MAQQEKNLVQLVYSLVGIFLIVLITSGSVYLFSQTRNNARSYSYIGRTPETIKTMNFKGEGKINVKPDIAIVSMGFTTEKKTVSEAQKESTRVMNGFIAKLKISRIEDKDIKTTNYNLYPQYDWTSSKQVLRGYQISQNIELKIRNLDKISDILGLAGEFGLNQVGDLRFDVDNKETILKQAKEEAIKKAKLNAQETTKSLGIDLGRIISYDEYNNDTVVYNGYRMDMMAKSSEGLGSAAPVVQSGNAEITVNAVITYEIN